MRVVVEPLEQWPTRFQTGLAAWKPGHLALFVTCTLVAALAEAGSASPGKQPVDFPGIVLDDEAGEFSGQWVASSKQPPYVGPTYRHDNNSECGQRSARFTPRPTQDRDRRLQSLQPSR